MRTFLGGGATLTATVFLGGGGGGLATGLGAVLVVATLVVATFVVAGAGLGGATWRGKKRSALLDLSFVATQYDCPHGCA